MEDNVRGAALAVGRSVDQNVTSLAQLSNREARTKELEKILLTLPDLLNIVLYEFPPESGKNPVRIASAGPTELPLQEGAPDLVQRVREERQPLIDYADRREDSSRLFGRSDILDGMPSLERPMPSSPPCKWMRPWNPCSKPPERDDC